MKLVNVVIYDGVDELDFCGPLEALASCRQVVDGKRSETPSFRVETVAARVGSIQCAHGVSVVAHKSLAQAQTADIVIVPGGPGSRRETLPPAIFEFLQRMSETADVVASVSTGVFILAKAGLCDGRRVTTHHAMTGELARLYPRLQVVSGQRVVSDGNDMMSSAGVSAGVDLALALIVRYEGSAAARFVARRLEWPGY